MLKGKSPRSKAPVFAVAPMIDWTDRHCRFFHRQLSSRAVLYTEMVVADAILHGPRERLLGHDAVEHPVVLQLGGSSPQKLSEAVKIAADFAYDEINLNVGCPSDRLMKTPALVAECVSAMKAVSSVPVTVKCRIGVDDQQPEEVLPAFVAEMADAGADAVWIHARKAWLQGLSPKENRDIPPLDYDLVHAVKRDFPHLFIGINGGVVDLNQALHHLSHVDGVMLGRAAYQNAGLLTGVDEAIYGAPHRDFDWQALCETMMAYGERVMASGGRLNHVTRHMVGLFQGFAGARRYRQILSSEATKPGIDPELIARAFAAVDIAGGPTRVMDSAARADMAQSA
jgi:tRNA-dihydrouridine synthase A